MTYSSVHIPQTYRIEHVHQLVKPSNQLAHETGSDFECGLRVVVDTIPNVFRLSLVNDLANTRIV